jgi:hypothetical protein
VYRHPRDADGRLVAPAPSRQPKREQTLEEELATAAAVMASLGASEEKTRQGLDLIRQRRQGARDDAVSIGGGG